MSSSHAVMAADIYRHPTPKINRPEPHPQVRLLLA